MNKRALTLILCAVFGVFRAQAQFQYMTANLRPFPSLINGKFVALNTGYMGGYEKVSAVNINTVQQIQAACTGQFGYIAYNYNPDSVEIANQVHSGAKMDVLILNNADSTAGHGYFSSVGHHMPSANTFTPDGYGQTAHKRKGCTNCPRYVWFGLPGYTGQVINPLPYYNEFVLDTPITCVPDIPSLNAIDPAANSITIYHGMFDIFSDTMSTMLKNIDPNQFGKPLVEQTAILYSRIYRFQSSPNISSPMATNKDVIIGIKGRPSSYSFGYRDKEHDSISVAAVHIPVSLGRFHPNFVSYRKNWPMNVPFDTAIQSHIRRCVRDSFRYVTYAAGYSPAAPFGSGAAYSLDSRTGDISFTAADTGMYFLAYQITEYRNGLPLGDVINYRVAYIIPDTTVVQPTINAPDNVAGGTFDGATRTFSVCGGTTLSFRMGASSTQGGAKIRLETNAQLACPGSTVAVTAQGSGVPQLTFSWQPSANQTGWYYVYLTATDTACGSTHAPVPVTYSFRIYVPARIKAAARDTLACTNAPNRLYLSAGAGQGPVQWATLSGGDPQLSCTTCDTVSITPDSTTRYVATVSAGGCTFRDTVTVRVVRRPVAGPITAIPVPGQVGRYSFASAGLGASSFTWSFGNGQSGSGASIGYTYSNNGSYTVRLIASNACGSDTAYTTLTIKGLGVNATQLGNDVRIYPNPANEEIFVKSMLPISLIQITDAGGRVLLDKELSNVTDYKVSVKFMVAGNYSVRIVTGKGIFVRKVVISH